MNTEYQLILVGIAAILVFLIIINNRRKRREKLLETVYEKLARHISYSFSQKVLQVASNESYSLNRWNPAFQRPYPKKGRRSLRVFFENIHVFLHHLKRSVKRSIQYLHPLGKKR